MTKTCVFDANGNLINIGEWEYQYEQVEVEPAEYDEKGNLIKEAVYEERTMNPLPDGAYTEEREVVEGPDGGLYLADQPIPPSAEERLEALETALLEVVLGG